MFYILSVANREKLQPQRKITKKGYSPEERKERAGSGTELLAGLREGTAVLTPPDNPTCRLGGWREPAVPTSPAELCILFHYSKRRDALNIHGHAHTRLVLLACSLASSLEQMCTQWLWACRLPWRGLREAPHGWTPRIPAEQQTTWKHLGLFQVGNREAL